MPVIACGSAGKGCVRGMSMEAVMDAEAFGSALECTHKHSRKRQRIEGHNNPQPAPAAAAAPAAGPGVEAAPARDRARHVVTASQTSGSSRFMRIRGRRPISGRAPWILGLKEKEVK
jgi:hypothetical protein